MTSIQLYGDVGTDITAQGFSQQLDQARGGEITLNVFSGGGDAGEGLAIYNILERYQGRIVANVDGVVASAGTLPLMAADRVYMPQNALMMVHDCHVSFTSGNAALLRNVADRLDNYSASYKAAYQKKTGKSAEEVAAWMSANNGRGTWFTAAEALAAGLVDELTGALPIAASVPPLDMSRWEDMEGLPDSLKIWAQAKMSKDEGLPAPMSTQSQAGGAPAVATEAAPSAQAAPEAAVMAAVDPSAIQAATELAALRRENAIRQQASHAGLDPEKVQAWIDGGQPLEAVTVEIIKAASAKSEQIASLAGHPARISVTMDGGDKVKAGIEAHLLARLSPGTAPDPAAREYRGYRVMDCIRAMLEVQGVNTRGRSLDETIVLALSSTSDFPLLLEKVGDKRLRDAYQEESHTWAPIATQRNLPDFKLNSSYMAAGDLIPKELKEDGTYQVGTMVEGKTTWRLATYGRQVLFSREMMINDDMSAFDRAPERLGRGFRRLESNMIWGLITGNAVSTEDGLPLFDTAHNNTFTGALSVTSFAQGKKLMRKQTDIDGTAINIEPGFLVGPSDLEATILQFLDSINYTPAQLTGNAGPNPYRGSVQPIIEPRLDASATQWYLIAPRERAGTIVWGYLQDEPGPSITATTTRNPDGLNILARFDFGCAIEDWRGIVRSSGT